MEHRLVLVPILFTLLCLPPLSSTHKEGHQCIKNSECDPGLHCEVCLANANFLPKCTRIKATSPISQVKTLPFNRYSWLTTHNSFAKLGDKPVPTNQKDSITSQLKNGVRGLMLDMYDYKGDVWLCHSHGGKCLEGDVQLNGLTDFKPAIEELNEVTAFLEANPSEIVTIMIEDYVKSPMGLTRVFDVAGLKKFWFPVSRMPKKGEDWPTVADMIQKNQRLVVFTSSHTKEAEEGVAYQWNYMVENNFGDGGMKAGSCSNRAESLAMNNTTRSLVLVNYFRDFPTFLPSCTDNSDALLDMVNTCYNASGKRWPNFIAVDFYRESDGGTSAPKVADEVNGQLVCGCASIADCSENVRYGTCPPGAPKKSGSSFGYSVSFVLVIVSFLLSFRIL